MAELGDRFGDNVNLSNLEEAGFCIRGVDKIQTCKNKWENLRKDHRNYISKFQQTGSGANDTQKKPKFFDSIEAVIGSSNHSFRPPYVSDSLYHNPHKFKVEGEIKKTANDSNNSSLCGVALQEEPKPLGISCTEKNNSGMLSYISDDDIFLDSLDEASGSTQTKRKRPSKASKTDKGVTDLLPFSFSQAIYHTYSIRLVVHVAI
ncbi:hypothetical protein OUZ56_012085 [Daphnia magna]|uniref:MADF domain-containing protein n=1 Tax=Daphnia magna TaxID=35525 RepID=A0ABQ9Z1Z8_9CRUS|nr:hypothetical protein OUZ56_012085 [Daphnia magna]